jgi:hypothetical protein
VYPPLSPQAAPANAAVSSHHCTHSIVRELKPHYLRCCARIVTVFPPSRRHAKLTKFHYMRLVPFAEQTELHAWLKSVAEQLNLSTRALYILACQKFGKPTTTATKRRTR